MRKWKENEEMERERHFLILSPFPLNFLIFSPFPLHFLAARLQGCNDSCSPVYDTAAREIQIRFSIILAPAYRTPNFWIWTNIPLQKREARSTKSGVFSFQICVRRTSSLHKGLQQKAKEKPTEDAKLIFSRAIFQCSTWAVIGQKSDVETLNLVAVQLR